MNPYLIITIHWIDMQLFIVRSRYSNWWEVKVIVATERINNQYLGFRVYFITYFKEKLIIYKLFTMCFKVKV
jgi:hypothetical protein